jgi:hypothetical protein
MHTKHAPSQQCFWKKNDVNNAGEGAPRARQKTQPWLAARMGAMMYVYGVIDLCTIQWCWGLFRWFLGGVFFRHLGDCVAIFLLKPRARYPIPIYFYRNI